MKTCEYCGRENIDQAVHCSECGTSEFISPQAAVPAAETSAAGLDFVPLASVQQQDHLVTLMRCSSLLEADMIVSQLETAGITAFIPDQFLMQAEAWHVNTYGFVRVQVSPRDYQAAKEFLCAPVQNEI
jgi:hypothetical protein